MIPFLKNAARTTGRWARRLWQAAWLVAVIAPAALVALVGIAVAAGGIFAALAFKRDKGLMDQIIEEEA